MILITFLYYNTIKSNTFFKLTKKFSITQVTNIFYIKKGREKNYINVIFYHLSLFWNE